MANELLLFNSLLTFFLLLLLYLFTCITSQQTILCLSKRQAAGACLHTHHRHLPNPFVHSNFKSFSVSNMEALQLIKALATLSISFPKLEIEEQDFENKIVSSEQRIAQAMEWLLLDPEIADMFRHLVTQIHQKQLVPVPTNRLCPKGNFQTLSCSKTEKIMLNSAKRIDKQQILIDRFQQQIDERKREIQQLEEFLHSSSFFPIESAEQCYPQDKIQTMQSKLGKWYQDLMKDGSRPSTFDYFISHMLSSTTNIPSLVSNFDAKQRKEQILQYFSQAMNILSCTVELQRKEFPDVTATITPILKQFSLQNENTTCLPLTNENQENHLKQLFQKTKKSTLLQENNDISQGLCHDIEEEIVYRIDKTLDYHRQTLQHVVNDYRKRVERKTKNYKNLQLLYRLIKTRDELLTKLSDILQIILLQLRKQGQPSKQGAMLSKKTFSYQWSPHQQLLQKTLQEAARISHHKPRATLEEITNYMTSVQHETQQVIQNEKQKEKDNVCQLEQLLSLFRQQIEKRLQGEYLWQGKQATIEEDGKWKNKGIWINQQIELLKEGVDDLAQEYIRNRPHCP